MFQPTFKNFNINYDSASERTTVSSGDLITGHICFDLTKETKINSITMTVSGKVHVHWSTGGGGGRKRRSRRTFSAKVDLFNLRSVIMQENSATGGHMKLQPGRHMFPFSCQLPQGDFPSSFKATNGQILYALTVSISRPWHMSKEFVTELNFVSHIDTNQPVLRAPLSGSNQETMGCLSFASQPITVAARTEKKAFAPGETVKVFCEFSNSSSRTATLKMKLQQRLTFYTLNRVSKMRVAKYLALAPKQSVGAHTFDGHTEITLTIPSLAQTTISNCSILEVEYYIEVTLSGCAFPDITVLFPIVLADTPVLANPPAYL